MPVGSNGLSRSHEHPPRGHLLPPEAGTLAGGHLKGCSTPFGAAETARGGYCGGL